MTAAESTSLEKREAIRLTRDALGLTQLELAEAAGISQSKMSLYEKGHVELTAAEQRKIESALIRALGKSPITRPSFHGGGVINTYTALMRHMAQTGARPGVLNALAPPEKTENAELDSKAQRKLRRQRAGISQHALARAVGIYRSKITEWENGNVELTPAEQAKVEEALSAAEERKRSSDPYFKLERSLQAEQILKERLAASRAVLQVDDELLQIYKDGVADIGEGIQEDSKRYDELKAKCDALTAEVADLKGQLSRSDILIDAYVKLQNENGAHSINELRGVINELRAKLAGDKRKSSSNRSKVPRDASTEKNKLQKVE